MITAILSATVIWCMFYGRIAPQALAPFCAGLGVALALLCRHRHTQYLTIDVLAQVSRLKAVNPTLKFVTVVALMMMCVSSGSPYAGVFLTAAALLLAVFAGGLRLRDYARLMAMPVSFLMISGLALLFEATKQRAGVLGFPVFGIWLCVSADTQALAAFVTARAMGAVSCLYFLSLTTPVSELIGVLRRARCPDVIIELMYLIYRYIFILLSMVHTMRDAAKSRLGFADYRAGIRSTGNIYSNLLSRSYRQAGKNFDAMESRCYEKGIRFLEKRQRVTGLQVAATIIVSALTLTLSML